MIRVVDRDLQAQLRLRYEADQEIRRGLNDPGALSPDRLRRMAEVDRDNSEWLRGVITRHGWPGRSLVGVEGARHAWLLAQHADRDPALQAVCLELLGEAARQGEATGSQVAYLTDRVRCARGEPQTYGTQLWYGPDGTSDLEPKPIADPDRLDARRASVGLEPFGEYLARLRGTD